MVILIEQDELRQGLLGLLVSVLEIVYELLERQAIRRMESGRLIQSQVETLGAALMDVKAAIEQIKAEHDLRDAVKRFRSDLDRVFDNFLDKFERESVKHGF